MDCLRAGSRTLLCGMVLAVAWPAASAGQPAESQTFDEELVVSEVLIDALVTDKKGQVILGLGPDDFVVIEDGELMDLVGVSFYSSQVHLPSDRLEIPGFDLSEIPQDRQFIVLLQEQRFGGSVGNLGVRRRQAGQKLVEWMVEVLQPADRVAIASYGFSLKLHQDFTRDRKLLIKGMESAVRGSNPESEWPSRRPPESAMGPLRERLPSGKELRKASRDIYKGIELLSSAAAHVPGRKNMVFFSNGFGSFDDDTFYRIQPVIRALNDANIAAYTIDLQPTPTVHTFRSALNNLAVETGGEFFFNFISFATPLRRVAETTTGYYLLAYRSSHPASESGYQRVKIGTRNREFRVRARHGYSYGDGE